MRRAPIARARRQAFRFVWTALLAVLPLAAEAWVYPEHRQIALTAVAGLDADGRARLEQLWQDARAGDEGRMCAAAADVAQGVTPPCIDWAALSAIAGDHSCSSAKMLQWVRQSDWILVVADIAAQLREDLARVAADEARALERKSGAEASPLPGFDDLRRRLADEGSRAKRQNALRTADIRLQRADPSYARRADANLAHFLMPRADTSLDPLAYAARTLRSGSPLNAAGVYVWHHLSALQKADRIASGNLPDDERRALARAALLDEAFALHFLQDMFAAGHIAGSWGDVSQRKGTHDYYNENGIEVITWRGRGSSIVTVGDAHLRDEDAALAASAVRASLVQVIEATRGRFRGHEFPHVPATTTAPETLDICDAQAFPDRSDRLGAGLLAYKPLLEDVLLDTPVPGLGPGLGAQPRSRSELGAFAGLAAAIETRRIDGGFDPSQNEAGMINGLDIGIRAGVGLEGALGDSGDGLAFVQASYHADGPSSNRLASDLATNGNFYAAVPARSGAALRVRMPYYALPGDLLLLSPLYFFDRERYADIAVSASNGGLLGLQRGYATRFGRFQFVLGREIGLTWYGLDGSQQLLVPPSADSPAGRLLRFKSLNIDVPIAEFRPYRSFAADQSSTLLFQLFAGFDRPYAVVDETPGDFARTSTLRTVRQLGIRMVFDWRHYR